MDRAFVVIAILALLGYLSRAFFFVWREEGRRLRSVVLLTEMVLDASVASVVPGSRD